MRKARMLVLVAAALLVAPPTAGAKAHVVRCNGHTYSLIDPAAFPGIGKLRAIGLPARPTATRRGASSPRQSPRGCRRSGARA